MKTKTLLLTSCLLIAGTAFAASVQPTKAEPQSHHAGKFYLPIEAGLAIPFKGKITNGGKRLPLAVGKTVPPTITKPQARRSLALGIGGGYMFNEFFRADMMFGYKSYDYWPSMNVGTCNLMANGYLEAHNTSIFTPYVLGGIGFGFSKMHDANHSIDANGLGYDFKKTSNFNWNLGLGVRVKITNSVDVNFTYKYVKLGQAKYTGDPAGKEHKFKKVGANELLAGLIFWF